MNFFVDSDERKSFSSRYSKSAILKNLSLPGSRKQSYVLSNAYPISKQFNSASALDARSKLNVSKKPLPDVNLVERGKRFVVNFNVLLWNIIREVKILRLWLFE